MWSRLASSPTEDMTGLAMGSRLASSPTEDMTERGQALPLPLLSFYKIRGLLIHRGYTHCPKKNLNLHIKKRTVKAGADTTEYNWRLGQRYESKSQTYIVFMWKFRLQYLWKSVYDYSS